MATWPDRRWKRQSLVTPPEILLVSVKRALQISMGEHNFDTAAMNTFCRERSRTFLMKGERTAFVHKKTQTAGTGFATVQ
jgi:hypothetical protein